MIMKLFTVGLLGLGLALPLAAATPANAGNLDITVTVGNDHRPNFRYDRRFDHERDRRFHPRLHVAQCMPGEAIYKAKRIGVRHARVDRVGRKFVMVGGRKLGSRVKVAFYRNSPHCRVAWVDRSPVYRYGRVQY